MTSAEYKEIRIALNLSQAQLAEIMDVSRATIARRESGNEPVPREAAMVLMFLCSLTPPMTHNGKNLTAAELHALANITKLVLAERQSEIQLEAAKSGSSVWFHDRGNTTLATGWKPIREAE